MSAGASSVLTTMSNSAANYKTIELACMVLSALPLIIVYPFAQKFFEKGVMVGSVKADRLVCDHLKSPLGCRCICGMPAGFFFGGQRFEVRACTRTCGTLP